MEIMKIHALEVARGQLLTLCHTQYCQSALEQKPIRLRHTPPQFLTNTLDTGRYRLYSPFSLRLQVEYLFSDKTGTLTKNEMSFQRLAVSEGSFLAQNATLLPLYEVRASEVSNIYAPRVSGQGFPAAGMPRNVQTLFLHLALCNTVRVEEDPDAVKDREKGGPVGAYGAGEESKRDALKRRVRAKLKKMRRNRNAPPSREWTLKRRMSAMVSAGEAVARAKQGSPIQSGEDYEYQVSC